MTMFLDFLDSFTKIHLADNPSHSPGVRLFDKWNGKKNVIITGIWYSSALLNKQFSLT